MASTQERLKAETANLVQALRAPSVRGRWGEIHLRRVVELAGMTEHCDFEEQVSVQTEDGRQRPDLVVRLPGGKRIIVDAKVPLKAYLEAQEEADGGAREAKLVEYARQVREHVVRLGGKKYWDQFQDAPDFVVMYVPGEAFFSAALQADPELHEFGFSRKVLLTSPTNLIAILKSVYYGWQQEKVRESAQKIRDLGMELFDRLRVMAEHLNKVGTGLGQAVDAFNEVAGSFEHRVLVSARRFKDLGAASSKDLPEIEPVERAVRTLAPADDETPRMPGGEDPA
jgi:DNA recombination protein RmuC